MRIILYLYYVVHNDVFKTNVKAKYEKDPPLVIHWLLVTP